MASAKAGAVKFLRQFAAVVAVVAVVVLLGLVWTRFAPSLPGEGPSGELAVPGNMVPSGVKLARGGRIVANARAPSGVRVLRINGGGTPSLDLGDLLQPENVAVLRYNAELEAAIIAAVVIASASYRSLRRSWRAKAGARPPADSD
jgi:hypothetical protein